MFIPIAEDTGSIADLTCTLLARAVRDAKSWPDDIFISINLSPRQFADLQLPQRIFGILEMGGFTPRRLEVEITETAVVHSLDDAKRILQKLRDVGVRIALDDSALAMPASITFATFNSTQSRSTGRSSARCWTSPRKARSSRP